MKNKKEEKKSLPSIKEYGLERKTILGKLNILKSEEEKISYLESIVKLIDELDSKLYLILRYLNRIERERRKIIGGYEITYNIKELITSLEKINRREKRISKNRLTLITQRIERSYERKIYPIYLKAAKTIIHRFSNDDYAGFLIETIAINNFANVEMMEKYTIELKTKSDELYELYLWIHKETGRNKMYSSFKKAIKNAENRMEKNKANLKKFNKYELQNELEPYAKEYKLEIGESVRSSTVQLITRKLIKKGWNAKETSVAEAFRKMGYVKGRRM